MPHLTQGLADSPIRVVIFEDLQCPDCRTLHRWIDRRLLPAWGDRVAFEHHDFPLPKHDWARSAAAVAKYFDGLGPEIGIAFRRQILEELMLVDGENIESWVREFAVNNETDPDRAAMSLGDPELAAAVEADYQDGLAREVKRTPTVFVDGYPFVESFPYEDLAAAVARAVRNQEGQR